MTEDNARENARQEMQRGNEALAAAKHLLNGGFLSDAVSRAYYAAYHCARAVLISRGIEPRTHRGVIQLLGLRFVKEGLLSEDAAAELAHLETYRELSDYTPATRFTEDQARDEVGRAERFIQACRPLLISPHT